MDVYGAIINKRRQIMLKTSRDCPHLLVVCVCVSSLQAVEILLSVYNSNIKDNNENTDDDDDGDGNPDRNVIFE